MENDHETCDADAPPSPLRRALMEALDRLEEACDKAQFLAECFPRHGLSARGREGFIAALQRLALELVDLSLLLHKIYEEDSK